MKILIRSAALLILFTMAHVAGLIPDARCQAAKEKMPATIASSVNFMWKVMQDEFISAADAMPEEKYSFAPTNGAFQGVRTFAEQVKHVACANFGFFSEFEGRTPPPDCEKGGGSYPAHTKAELMKYLRDSFAYGDKMIASLDEKNALDPVTGRYAGPNTKLGISVVAVWHGADHYGQMVEYLRMNGIIPPASRPAPPSSGKQ
jgi:hypothetical protein